MKHEKITGREEASAIAKAVLHRNPLPSFPPSPESDPHGRAPSEPGAKLDAGKQRPALVLGEFARALAAVTAIGTYGAVKYTPSGWLSVPDGQARYSDAALRHLLAHWQGEAADPESGLPHLAHAAWNILAVLELQGRGQ